MISWLHEFHHKALSGAFMVNSIATAMMLTLCEHVAANSCSTFCQSSSTSDMNLRAEKLHSDVHDVMGIVRYNHSNLHVMYLRKQMSVCMLSQGITN